DRFGDPAALAHVQLLGIDTDPRVLEASPRGALAPGLTRDEVLLARLSRSSHYLRPRDPLPRVEDWLPPRALHRLSRTPATNGSRALGRLALLDNYHAVVQRLRQALRRVTDREVLHAAARRTGLALGSSKPRLYLVAGLGGGGGSGMVLDLA